MFSRIAMTAEVNRNPTKRRSGEPAKATFSHSCWNQNGAPPLVQETTQSVAELERSNQALIKIELLEKHCRNFFRPLLCKLFDDW